MPRYDVFLEGRAESSTRYFAVSVMADDPKEAEFLGHEAGRVKHQECDEIEVVGVMSVTSDLNAGKGRLCWRISFAGPSPKPKTACSATTAEDALAMNTVLMFLGTSNTAPIVDLSWRTERRKKRESFNCLRGIAGSL